MVQSGWATTHRHESVSFCSIWSFFFFFFVFYSLNSKDSFWMWTFASCTARGLCAAVRLPNSCWCQDGFVLMFVLSLKVGCRQRHTCMFNLEQKYCHTNITLGDKLWQTRNDRKQGERGNITDDLHWIKNFMPFEPLAEMLQSVSTS